MFNADRYENRVKLLYFSVDDDGGFGAKVLFEDYFIGNDNMTEGEKSKVNPKVAALDKVWLKVIVSCETDGVWAEFYADGIRRFGADNAILLSSANAGSDGTAEETAEKTESAAQEAERENAQTSAETKAPREGKAHKEEKTKAEQMSVLSDKKMLGGTLLK